MFDDALWHHGEAEARRLAIEIASAGLLACDPIRVVKQILSVDDSLLLIDGERFPLNDYGRIHLIGAGKASLRIAETVAALLGSRQLDTSYIAVPPGEPVLQGLVMTQESDHPFPTERSLTVGRRLYSIASKVQPGDLVIACFTGGSSALACYPPIGVQLSEKVRLNELLLRSGADIVDINAVRKHVSRIKGGRLAAKMLPAQIVNLTISDVMADPLDCITDLTVPDTTTPEDSLEVLKSRGLWFETPESIRWHLESPAAESPSLDAGSVRSFLLANGATACTEMAKRAESLGVIPLVLGTGVKGESSEVGRALAELAITSAQGDHSNLRPTAFIACGGETAVSLGTGLFGAGGPNQELALAAAIHLTGQPRIAFLAMDTDGSDGGTRYAGGLVDGTTYERCVAAGVHASHALRMHQSRAALLAADDLLETGRTGTNVNDLIVIVVMGATVSEP